MNVDTMIEVNEAGKIVHSDPLDRSVVAKAISDRRKYGAIRPDLAMAVHASFCRRNASEGTCFNRSVAISAIDSIVADVVLMAKWNWLGAGNTDFGDVGRFVNGRQRSHQRDQ
jgi:hypothetical protein